MMAAFTTAVFRLNCHATSEASPALTTPMTTSSSQRLRSVENKTAAPSGPTGSPADGSESRYAELPAELRLEMIRSCAAKRGFLYGVLHGRTTAPTNMR